MKFCASIIVVSFSACLAISPIHKNKSKHMGKKTMIIEEPVQVVAFDLHDVIVNKSYSKMVRAFGAYCFAAPATCMYCVNPFFWAHLRRVWKYAQTAEYIYDEMAKKYPRLVHGKQQFLDICNGYEIVPEMHHCVVSLKKNGYKVVLLSNIGEQALEKFDREFPHLFEEFDCLIMTQAVDGYSKKPSDEYFERAKRTLSNRFGIIGRCIFVDDKQKNIDAGNKHGFESILFTGFPALEKRFEDMGIVLKS